MNPTPPLSSHNRYSLLSVDTLDNTSDDNLDGVKVIEKSREIASNKEYIRLTSWERRLPQSYVISSDSSNSLDIDVEIETTDTSVKRGAKALVDCGATGLFIDIGYVQKNNITVRQLTRPIPVYNVDGSPNEAGEIREVADLVLVTI